MKQRATALLTGMAVALFISGCTPQEPINRVQSGECRSGRLAGAFLAALPGGGGHDQVLLDQAVLYHVNRVRCAEGLAPLASDAALRQAAKLHSRDMARLEKFSHELPVPGRRTLPERLASLSVSFQTAAENIIEAHFLAYRSGAPYKVIDPVRCAFAYVDGTRIERHSYASLAEEVVTRWMTSPGHRRNILNPRLRRHGFALSPNSNQNLCGGLSATQVFAG